MTKNKSHLQKQLEAVVAERDAFVNTANQQIAFLNGKIAMLEEMIEPPEVDTAAVEQNIEDPS